ncbi:MAG: hypothetical protein V1866_00690 [archaeon]
MELFSRTSENKFVLVFLQNKNYMKELGKIVKPTKSGARICYVCLSKPYSKMMDNLKSEKVNYENFIFIDTMSSPQYKLKPVKNCIFVSGPENLDDIRKAIRKATQKYNCDTIIFDTISTLLIYQQTHKIVRFTHELIADKIQKTVNKVYFVLKETGLYKSESAKLIKDLNLFADKIVKL